MNKHTWYVKKPIYTHGYICFPLALGITDKKIPFYSN